MNKVQHVKWCIKQTKLTSEISCPTDSCLAQLVRHWTEDSEVLVSNPTGGNFWWIFFWSSLYKDLSDNLTETPIVKNSNAVCDRFLENTITFHHDITNAFTVTYNNTLGIEWLVTMMGYFFNRIETEVTTICLDQKTAHFLQHLNKFLMFLMDWLETFHTDCIQMGILTKTPDNFFGPHDHYRISKRKIALEFLHYFYLLIFDNKKF